MLESEKERHRRYREQGWWPGERLQDRYARIVGERPGDLAVVDDRGHRLSHAELWQSAGSLAEELEARGLTARDVVLIFLPNRVEWQIALLAVLRLGATPASIPIRTSSEALAYVAGISGARLIIASERHGGAATGDLARAAAAANARAPPVLSVDEHAAYRWSGEPTVAGPQPPAVPELDHLMFTSSTTGYPKAVMHTADTLAALNITFTERFELGPERPIFMPSPLGHSVGAIHGARLALHNGAPLVLQDRWDPRTALDLVAEHSCAFTAAATPFLKDLVDAPWRGAAPKLSPLRWFLCGGAQVPPALMSQAQAAFPDTFVTVLWGMTEGGLTTCVMDSPREKVLHTAGVALPGLELCTRNSEGCKLAPGEEGELSIRGPGVFVGYLGQQDLYRSLLTPDGFFATGDLARIDADGYVRITGRLKDLIVRGGINISPVPIEDALAAHPDVLGVAVIGYPDERLGERICAVVIPRGDTPPSLEALVAFARSQGLPKSLWPEIARFVEAFPRTAAGKIRKNQLFDTVVESDAGQRAAGKA